MQLFKIALNGAQFKKDKNTNLVFAVEESRSCPSWGNLTGNGRMAGKQRELRVSLHSEILGGGRMLPGSY